MKMNDEKKYLKPDAEIVLFTNDDIITDSGDEPWGGIGGTNDTEVP